MPCYANAMAQALRARDPRAQLAVSSLSPRLSLLPPADDHFAAERSFAHSVDTKSSVFAAWCLGWALGLLIGITFCTVWLARAGHR